MLSTLRWFRDEYEAHIYERPLPGARLAPNWSRISIDAEKCKGCTLCAKKCPAEAIVGTLKSPHHIIAERCVACGSCVDVCDLDAVLVH